jgi:hypothetical protein
MSVSQVWIGFCSLMGLIIPDLALGDALGR